MDAPGFTGARLDRADHLRGDANALAAARADPAARLLRLEAMEPVLDAAGRLTWTPLPAGPADYAFLGFADGVPHFVALDAYTRGAGRSAALSAMLDVMPADEAAVFGAARQLVDWHGRTPYCAACGGATALIRGGWARKCGSCGTEYFPRVDPVVIMIAEHDGRALVGRGINFPPGRYSALAGFVEPGESIEEAVARELFEEAGVRVRGVRYVASQPWPFPGQLMIACIAAADDAALTIDATELADAMWVTRAEVRAALAGDAARFRAPPAYAIARTLLSAWADA